MNIKTKRGLTALAAVPFLAFGAPTAMAVATGATTFTQTDQGLVDSFPTNNPCTGAPGTVSDVYNDVFHVTVTPNGSASITGTQEAQFTFTPIDPSLPTYTGHFTDWFGAENIYGPMTTQTSTFTINAIGSDGSHLRFHEDAHFTLNPNGVVTVTFDHVTCGD